jgi:endonuclease-3
MRWRKKRLLKMSDTISTQKRIRQILDLLGREYGIPEWQPSSDPVSVLVKTILSQNTSDTNSGSAFQSLLDSFDNWEEAVDADVYDIARCIRGGGLGRVKAQRIKQALGAVLRRRGRLDLGFLSQLTPPDAEDWLLKLPGIGLKTARCVLLFSLGMPALPVDTHILRVSKRLGLISSKASLQEAHHILGELVPPADVYQFHILVIQHGRKICQARHPNCNDCVLKKICRSYNL